MRMQPTNPKLTRNDRDLRALKANPPASLQTTAREVEEFLTSFEDGASNWTRKSRKSA